MESFKKIEALLEDINKRLERIERLLFATYGVPSHLLKAQDPQPLPLSPSGSMVKHNLEQTGAINYKAVEMERLEAAQRAKYGKENGHFKWDLAKAFFNMSNDSFFKQYGFNFVPKGKLFDEAKDHVYNAAAQATGFTTSEVVEACKAINAAMPSALDLFERGGMSNGKANRI